MRPGLSLALLCALLFLPASVAVAAEAGPRLPCGDGPPLPPYPTSVDAPPNLAVWHGGELVAGWRPSPRCGVDWPREGRPTLAVALAGSFRHAGTADELLARFGRVSALRDARYWSATDGRWRPLVTDAAALAGPDPVRRRPDFTAAEMRTGGDLLFVQRDGRSSGEVVYRLRASGGDARRLVLAVENLSPVRLLLLTVFAPGDLRSTYVLEPLAPGVWGYYCLVAVRAGGLAGGHEASYVNRAVALYRHIAGVPTDAQPPPVPR